MSEDKSAAAFRTIGEVSAELGLPQHILRYWETRFSQLRPLTRAGNRRYYRLEDVALVKRIDQALNHDGYTIRGVQQLLAGKATDSRPVPSRPDADDQRAIVERLKAIRDTLAAALRETAAG